MTLQPFLARAGFDANSQRLINLADPATNAAGTALEPTDGVNVQTLRARSAFRIVADEAARLALKTPLDVIQGDVVIDADTNLAWVFNAPSTWTAFGRGGVRYVGRQTNLPTTAEDGDLYIIRSDFSGKPLERLVAWDASILARNGASPATITHSEQRGTPTLGVPSMAQIRLAGMPMPLVANAPARAMMRVSTAVQPTHRFDYDIKPGDTLHDIAAGLVAAYNIAGTHEPGTTVQARGDTIYLTGSPGSAGMPARPVTGQDYFGEVSTDADLATFIASQRLKIGDYVINGSPNTLNDPLGRPVPPDFALIIESVLPLAYHVADAATPLVAATTATQRATGRGTLLHTIAELNQWLQADKPVGDYGLNVSGAPITALGITLNPNLAVVATPPQRVGVTSQPVVARALTPAGQVMIGGWQPAQEITTPVATQADFDAMVRDPANQQDGFWWQNNTGARMLLYQATNNPTVPVGANFNVDPGTWIYWTLDFQGSGVAGWAGQAVNPGRPVGGTPAVPPQWLLPTTLPEAVYQIAAQPPAVAPTATAPAQAQVDPTIWNVPTFAIVGVGPTVQLQGGGWIYLNREVWSKPDRATADQQTNQRSGDLQVTPERNHEELKAWDGVGQKWDIIYSRDDIDRAIAALSLFEGTADEVGGGAIGAVEFDRLPDLQAMSASGDLSFTSHYWTYIGSPNYPVVAATPQIGGDLQGAVLNPGDWLQISNQGGDGSGIGANGGAIDLRWVTIGGDLLAKARADRLFGLLPWSAGGWEQGSLTLYHGDVYRATRGVTMQDPSPQPVATPLQLTPGAPGAVLNGAALVSLPTGGVDGDLQTATAAGSFAAAGVPFAGTSYAIGDSFIYSANAAFAGAGTTVEGYPFDQGWIRLGQISPIPNPLTVSIPSGTTPWAKVDISGGLKMAADMASLPTSAPIGQVWIVLAGAHSEQELYAYDPGAGIWQQLGGSSGTPIDLSGGEIVYPKNVYADGSYPGWLSAWVAIIAPPKFIGDLLITRNDAGYPLIKGFAKPAPVSTTAPHGAAWDYYHPARTTFNLDGTGRPGKADHPMQLNVGLSGGKAKITHISDRNLDWQPIWEPPAPVIPTPTPPTPEDRLFPKHQYFVASSGCAETTLTGTTYQTGNLMIAVPRGQSSHMITTTNFCTIFVDLFFPQTVDTNSSTDQYFNVETYISDNPNYDQGRIQDRSQRNAPTWDHWRHHFGASWVIQKKHVESNYFVHIKCAINFNQAQGGNVRAIARATVQYPIVSSVA